MGGQKPVGARRSRGGSHLGSRGSRVFSVWGSPLMLADEDSKADSGSTGDSLDDEAARLEDAAAAAAAAAAGRFFSPAPNCPP